MNAVSRILAISGFAALAFCSTIAGAQTATNTTKPATEASRLTAPTKTPTSPFGSVVGQRPTMATALNAKECKALGGNVGHDTAGLCGGGDICWRTDANGDIRRVCIKER